MVCAMLRGIFDVRNDICSVGNLHGESQLHIILPAHAIMLPFAGSSQTTVPLHR